MTHESTDFNQNDIKLKNISENLYKCEMEIYENSCCVFIFRSIIAFSNGFTVPEYFPSYIKILFFLWKIYTFFVLL